MFNLPDYDNQPSWGPPSEVPENMQFRDAPYAPFSKGDKLGKAADWAADGSKESKDQKRSQHGRGFRDPYHAYGASSSSFFANEETDSPWSFSVVDSSAKSASKTPKASNAILKTRGGRPGGPQQQQRSAGNFSGPSQNRSSGYSRNPPFQTIGQSRDNRGFRRPGQRQNDKAKNREPSVVIKPDWELIQSNNFNELQKLSYDVKPGTVIARYGYVHYFDKAREVSTIPTRMKPVENTVYTVTTSEDPVIQELAAKGTGKVYATDGVLALLMCATKSNQPWDLIINKNDQGIFIDKRDGGPLDFLTVDENSFNPPPDKADEKSESAQALGIEATYVNQNFAANVVTDETFKFENPNPFSGPDSSEPLLAKGYIYKSFNLEADPEAEPIDLVVRTEVDAAIQSDESEPTFISISALNEHGNSKPLEWKDRFTNHRGAIVTEEMKNNLNKLSQWTVQALLSGEKGMKIGFVSRVNAKERTQHDIIGILSRDPQSLANNLNLQLTNAWGIVKSMVNIVSDLGNGKFVLLRDPNASALRIYSVPTDTVFE